MTKSNKRIKRQAAQIGRFDGELKTIAFTANNSIQNLLDKAGISLSSGESVNDENGRTLSLNSKAKAQTYFIVGNYRSG